MAVQVRKVAGTEFQKPNNTLNDIHYAVLDSEFGVIVVSSNQVRSLVIWDWHSNVIKEVVVVSGLVLYTILIQFI